MPSRLPLAPLLGALIHLARHEPGATDAQAALLAAIRGLLGDAPLRITVAQDFLQLDDEAISLRVPGATVLNEHLLLHGIGTVELQGDADETDLLRLAAILAGFAGTYATHEAVLAALGASAPRVQLTAAADRLGIYPLASRPRLSDTVGGGARHPLDIQREDADAISPETADPPELVLQDSGASRRRSPLGAILSRGREAVAQEDWDGVLDAAIELIEAEDEAPSERTGQTYRQELRRLIQPEHLGMIARLAHGDRKQEVIGVLRRFGSAGTETLVELLVASPNLGERRSYYTAITQMRTGAEAIFGRLEHELWYVVRNAAELCGEMEISDAIPALGRQIQHPDERTRKAVAGALARIGTPLALQWVRKVLSDPSPVVCRQALAQLGGPAARELTPAIAALLEREAPVELQREALLALGRIGTPDALGVLAAWAAPTSKRFGQNPLPLRLLAVKGLSLGGPAAAATLSGLTRDAAPEVRAAAGAALEALRP